MKIWALSDLHLNLGTPDKEMAVFGPIWEHHMEKIEINWRRLVTPDDLVLIAGDLSWAMKLEQALADLEWVDRLPGTKLLLKGNHDYWWPSSRKLSHILPPSIHFIHRTVFNWNGVTIGGARLWEMEELSFDTYIEFRPNPKEKVKDPQEMERIKARNQKIFQKEKDHLKESLKQLDPKASCRIAMTHYPPVEPTLKTSSISEIFEQFHVNISLFGHLHQVKKNKPLFGEKNHVRYLLTSSDYLQFTPYLVATL